VKRGKVIETYLEDEPYPSCLISGRTFGDRPLHVFLSFTIQKKGKGERLEVRSGRNII